MKFKDLICVRENVLDRQFCEEIIQKFDGDDRKVEGSVEYVSEEGIYSPSLDSNLKKSYDLNITGIENWEEEDEIFYKSFNSNVKDYFEYIDTFSPLQGEKSAIGHGITNFKDRGYLIRSYEKSDGYFHWHNDFSYDKNHGLRMLTLIWYLNDVVEGGETEFIDGTIIKPKVGQLLIFPTSWYMVHRGKMPISNKKYIVTGWLYAHH